MIPKVSIIIPFYNCSYVDQAIQSALNQTYTNIEVIVVDDGSSRFTEKVDPFLQRIHYLKKENGGTATALNHGIHASSGEYIAWLSSDDYMLPEKISKQMSYMLSSNAEASFTDFAYMDKQNHVFIPQNGLRVSNIKELYQQFMHGNPVNGSTVVMEKGIFSKIGYFNPDLRFTHDYDMWFRLLLNGYKLSFLNEVLLKYRVHEDAGSMKYQSEIQKEVLIVESYFRPLLRDYMNQI